MTNRNYAEACAAAVAFYELAKKDDTQCHIGIFPHLLPAAGTLKNMLLRVSRIRVEIGGRLSQKFPGEFETKKEST